MKPTHFHRQQGMTLIMALIMLVVLTLLALTSFNLGKSNLQIVSNMQHRGEMVAAAHETIEQAMSNTRFIESPDAILVNPCEGGNTACVDTNGDGKEDVKVTLDKPACVKVAPIKQADLRLEEEDDRNCAQSANQSFGVAGAATGNSECSNSTWDIHATATDTQTQAAVEVVQGVSVRVPSDDTASACPTI